MREYRIWKGNIELELPHPPELQGYHRFRTAIEYLGMYRYGARRILHLNTNGESGITQQRNTRRLDYKLTLHWVLGSQSIQFDCDSITTECITGNYNTQNPGDIGTFKIKITTDTVFNDSQQLATTECVII